jgi:hypothetical protein
MNTARIAALALAISLLSISAAYAEASNLYQVTGVILSMTDATITVQKGSEKWELARDKATNVRGGTLKVGQKVTVNYRMYAVSVEVK